jgi:hypothetical protein
MLVDCWFQPHHLVADFLLLTSGGTFARDSRRQKRITALSATSLLCDRGAKPDFPSAISILQRSHSADRRRHGSVVPGETALNQAIWVADGSNIHHRVRSSDLTVSQPLKGTGDPMGSPAPSPLVWRDASRTPRFSPFPGSRPRNTASRPHD